MTRPGFYFCFCPDFNLLKMQISRILESSGQDWTKKNIWLDEQNQEERLWKAFNVPGMAGPPRALILRKCDSPHESLPGSFWKDISATLSGFRPRVWPFFCFESDWKYNKPQIPAAISRQKCFKFARQKGWIWEFSGLNPGNISRYIAKKCQKMGIEPGQGVLEELARFFPPDSHSVDMELEKLCLLIHPEKVIHKNHLKSLSSRPEIDIFSFLQAVQRGRNAASIWNKIFREQSRDKEILFPFLGLLLREARILWQLASGQENRVRLYPQIKQQKRAMALSMGQKKIMLLWDLALEAESGVKSGRISTDQAMESLTSRLLKLFSSPG